MRFLLRVLAVIFLMSSGQGVWGMSNSHLEFPLIEKNAAELESSYQVITQKANEELAALAKVKWPQKFFFSKSVKKLDDILWPVSTLFNRINLLREVTPDKELKEKSSELSEKLNNWMIDLYARKDIFEVLNFCEKHCLLLKAEDKQLLNAFLREFKKSGFHLSQETQDEIKKLKQELGNLELKISDNISENNKEYPLTEEDLEGLSADNKARLKNSEGKYRFRTGVASEVKMILEKANKESVRKEVFRLRATTAQEVNIPIMAQVFKKRAKMAHLLGYRSWADYKTEYKMVKSEAAAVSFVTGLSKRLETKFRAELEEMRLLKVADTGNAEAKIESWDVDYYQQKVFMKNYQVDLEGLKKFFKLENVLEGMFKSFEHSFGLTITWVNPPYVWHPDVKAIKISDAKTKEELGILYLDLFPRPEESKYGHFAMFGIRDGKMVNGRYERPAASLVCNFPKGTDKMPSLLSYDNVTTLFHEFGHGLHALLTRSTYHVLAGTNTVQDFVEAPSQLLENWVTDKNVLDTFASNYENPSEKISAEVLEKMNQAEVAKAGAFYRRQFSFGMMDLSLHSADIPDDKESDIQTISNKALSDYYLPFPEGTAYLAGFGHLFGGYDAGYYGYAWADSLAADLASQFEKSKDKYRDVKLGLKLRKEIYEKGASRDENTSVEKFLGRPSNQDAFIKKLGL